MLEKKALRKVNIFSYLQHHGFIIPNSKIYGGFANSWDLGPQGIEIKKNLKDLWWKYFVTSNPYNVGCDSSILTIPRVLEASGHLEKFCDWLTECIYCNKRYRLDSLLSEKDFQTFLLKKKTFSEIDQQENNDEYVIKKKCPDCGRSNSFTNPKLFNLLLSTNLGFKSSKNGLKTLYLRPETCQAIFTNILSIRRSNHLKLPFGIAQIGKSFRNEITLRHGIFRTLEFEQAELEFFFLEQNDKWWDYWNEQAWSFFRKLIINNPEKIKKVLLKLNELPHYARKTLDFYFEYSFGWGEICSNSDRGNYDLLQHQNFSKCNLSLDNFVPCVIEVSFGIERLLLAILEDSYKEEEIISQNKQIKSIRQVLRLSPILAPYFVAIIPFKKSLREEAWQLYLFLLKKSICNITYEESSSIGKSYRRQDALGTFFCLTVDQQSVQSKNFTLRYRDTTKQVYISLNDLSQYLNEEYQKYKNEFFKS